MSKGARNRTTKTGDGGSAKTAKSGKSAKSGTAAKSTAGKSALGGGGGKGRGRASRGVGLPQERNWGSYIFYGVISLIAVAAIAFAAIQANKPPIDGLEEFGDLKQGHTTSPVKYAQTPPVGGDHDPTWQNCGVYDKQLRNENAVHSLEHGAVWITYRPGLPAAQLNKLKQIVQSNDYTLLSPYPGLDSPIVLSAWGSQLKLDDASDPRVNEFLKMFVQGKQTPEPGALCSEGKATP
ncbi:MAG: DUF3105 domain-containing protein [Streptosporangiales bacterium]|nr:DUF3105 domain-containing protein [Streptosporangiales bacterium]